MSTVEFHCPHCRILIQAPGKFAGSTATCPQCRHLFTVSIPGDGYEATIVFEPEDSFAFEATANDALPNRFRRSSSGHLLLWAVGGAVSAMLVACLLSFALPKREESTKPLSACREAIATDARQKQKVREKEILRHEVKQLSDSYDDCRTREGDLLRQYSSHYEQMLDLLRQQERIQSHAARAIGMMSRGDRNRAEAVMNMYKGGMSLDVMPWPLKELLLRILPHAMLTYKETVAETRKRHESLSQNINECSTLLDKLADLYSEMTAKIASLEKLLGKNDICEERHRYISAQRDELKKMKSGIHSLRDTTLRNFTMK